MEPGEQGRQQTVATHRIEDARLCQHVDEYHAREPANRTDVDDWRQPWNMSGLHCEGERRGDVELAVPDEPGHYYANSDVDDRANRQRDEYPDRNVAARVLRFLRGGGDCVESDVGEEDDSRAAENTAQAERSELACVRWDERM